MKVAIVGHGFVGKALHRGLRNIDGVLVVEHGGPTVEETLEFQPDLVFLCLPTPSSEDGSCNDSLVMKYVKELEQLSYTGLTVVRSTVPLKTVDEIVRIDPSIVFWPELLRADTADIDFLNPDIVVIGSEDREGAAELRHFILQHTLIDCKTARNAFLVDARTASVFKYAVNSFLATKVVFMHQLALWLEHRGMSEKWHGVANLLSNEPRIGASHLMAPGRDGYGYRGECFPKDMRALIHQISSDGGECHLLKAVDKTNKHLLSKDTTKTQRLPVTNLMA